MPLSPGARLGPYEVLAPIGAGGMGEVYRARDTRLNRDVAIKVLPDDVATSPDRLARFEREAKAVAGLSHPNIVALHDFDSASGVSYAVMELLEGQTLRERLHAGAPPVRKCLEIAVQIARGLAAAHAKGVVHRDLKPENLFLGHDGQIKILDFGLAREMTAPSDAAATVTAGTVPGVVLGTVGYMAPEQVRSAAVDARADLFALGAVLHEMLSGRRAFHHETAAETMAAILRENPPELRTLRPDASPALEHIVRHCLEKNPAERFQSARDVAFALEALSGADSAPAIAALHRRDRRWRRLMWLGAAAALLLAGLAARPFFRSAPQQRTLWLSLTPPHETFAFYPAPAVSPDGKAIAFWAPNEAERVALWIRDLDAPASRAVPGTELPDADYPTVAAFWSPDGRRLAYFAEYQLKIVSLDGSPPVAIAEAGNTRGGSWCADGRIVFTPISAGPVFVVPAGGGPPVAVPGTGDALPLEFPDCLPNSRTFVASNPGGGIYVAALDGSASKKLLDLMSNAQYADGKLFFGRAGALWAQTFNSETYELSRAEQRVADRVGFGWGSLAAHGFSLSRDGDVIAYSSGPGLRATQPRWHDRAGRPGDGVGTLAENIGIALSPNGKTLVIERLDGKARMARLVLVDVATSAERLLTQDQSGPFQATPVWSGDGERVIYSTFGEGVYSQPVRGGAARQLFSQPGVWVEEYVPANDTVLFQRPQADRIGDIWMKPSGSPPRAYLATRYVEGQSRISPDGRWLAYTSSETGRHEVYVQAFPDGGNRVAISTNGAGYPEWRRDGRELYYLAFGSKLVAAEIDTTSSRVRIGKRQTLFTAPRTADDAGRRQYQPSLDGQRFLFNAVVESRNPQAVTVVLNWQAGR
jgi:serine/threonine protein kinase/Tol biopolymer transport system component